MKIELAESDAEILACFPVMRHLRELESAESFLATVRIQQGSGYQLAFLTKGGPPLAVAGFRLSRPVNFPGVRTIPRPWVDS